LSEITIEEFKQLSGEPIPRKSITEEIKALITNKPMTAAQIAKALDLKYNSVYGVLSRLVEKGIVIKKYDDAGKPYYCIIVE